MKKLSNISLRDFRAALSCLGLAKLRTSGGHETWWREGLTRAIVFQTHKDPVPEFIVKNIVRDLNMTREEFLAVLERL